MGKKKGGKKGGGRASSGPRAMDVYDEDERQGATIQVHSVPDQVLRLQRRPILWGVFESNSNIEFDPTQTGDFTLDFVLKLSRVAHFWSKSLRITLGLNWPNFGAKREVLFFDSNAVTQ